MDPVALAEALREALPNSEPTEVDTETLDEVLAALGVDAGDYALVGAALVEWERMLP